MTRQRSPRMRGPEGRIAKRQPSPEGLGNPQDDPSAVGAALNRSSTLPVSLGAAQLACGKLSEKIAKVDQGECKCQK